MTPKKKLTPREEALGIVMRGMDRHGWRAKSLAAAVVAIASTRDEVDPEALMAVAEMLDEHVRALYAALDRASAVLMKAEGPT